MKIEINVILYVNFAEDFDVTEILRFEIHFFKRKKKKKREVLLKNKFIRSTDVPVSHFGRGKKTKWNFFLLTDYKYK